MRHDLRHLNSFSGKYGAVLQGSPFLLNASEVDPPLELRYQPAVVNLRLAAKLAVKFPRDCRHLCAITGCDDRALRSFCAGLACC